MRRGFEQQNMTNRRYGEIFRNGIAAFCITEFMAFGMTAFDLNTA
ncbi:hypothetical protein [Sphingomonas sp. M1A8_2b]